MKKTILTALILSFLSVPLLFAQSDSLATLEITFTGIRNSSGLIAIGINDSPKGWPRIPTKISHWEKTTVQNGSLTAKIGGLKYGVYAVSVLDDENSNLEMDKQVGMPKEGCGFSNNAKMMLSTPSFEDCSFKIEKASQKISIQIKYWGE